jgi:hypothetical protein
MLPWLTYWTNNIREHTTQLEQWAATQPHPMSARYRYKRDPPLVDGFVIEIRGEQYGNTIDAFAETVRRVLKYLSDHDPSFLKQTNNNNHGVVRRRIMDQSNVGGSGWYYEYNREPLFVTGIAPCYGTDSPRYMWPTADNIDSCFILLQGEYGFR